MNEEKPEEATQEATEPEGTEPSGTEAPSEAPQWEYRERFKIHDRMQDIVEKTITATGAELAVLRRKLDKLTYGS